MIFIEKPMLCEILHLLETTFLENTMYYLCLSKIKIIFKIVLKTSPTIELKINDCPAVTTETLPLCI